MINQAKWTALMAGTTLLALSVAIDPAEAAAVKWSLQGATLRFENQDYSVAGSFVYDDATNTYSNISILSSWSRALYDGPTQAGSSDTQLNLSEVGFASLDLDLALGFADTLAGKLPGSTVLLNLASSSETASGSLFGFPIPPQTASFTSGSVVAIPTPALLPGLVGLGWAALRKRKVAIKP